KDGNVIGSGTTDNTGHVTITPTKPIPEGNVTAKATDTTPPVKPSVVGTLDGKAGTKDPVEVITDPNTKV
ncbi:hypothetical protein KJB97_12085, partial [Staphylococcus haemolyticus]|uniref:hypothetical protein n=1 Tax=Staphylococcus haemolyticus TaxID=1283 RepID=UPI001F1B6FAA